MPVSLAKQSWQDKRIIAVLHLMVLFNMLISFPVFATQISTPAGPDVVTGGGDINLTNGVDRSLDLKAIDSKNPANIVDLTSGSPNPKESIDFATKPGQFDSLNLKAGSEQFNAIENDKNQVQTSSKQSKISNINTEQTVNDLSLKESSDSFFQSYWKLILILAGIGIAALLVALKRKAPIRNS